MPNIVTQIQTTVIRFLQEHFFDLYLKIHAVGTHNRFQPSSRLSSYGRSIRALWRYPLSRAEADNYLTAIDHPQALKTVAQVESSLAKVRELGLPAHKGKEKNWDFLSAFSLILQNTGNDACIVDLGSGPTSVILEWLNLYNYSNLYGCDLIIAPKQSGHIQYTTQNLEQTSYPDGFADVITCLSVIEHGVNPEAFLKECHRLLKPDGLLIISTDYWCKPLDISQIEDEHGALYIFSPESIQSAIFDIAPDCGFDVIGTPDFSCGELRVERPHLPELDKTYTFYMMALKRA
ncbi:MAG: methyltransferase domain-containing protein [Anaerolineae bacterium]|nr:methyltransferase domain-containing protein [Anaerolineae bacterium]